MNEEDFPTRSQAAPGEGDLIAGLMCDNAGVSRAKLVPAKSFESFLDRGVGLSPVIAVYTATDLVPMTGTFIDGPGGDMRLVPDRRGMRQLSRQPRVLAMPVDQLQTDGSPFPGCQRSALKSALRWYEEEGLRVLVGMEVEWTVVPRDRDRPEATPAYGAGPALANAAYLKDLADRAGEAGIDLEQLHREYGPGQFETSFPPMEPVQAADTWVFMRELIRCVGNDHGLRTSFSPISYVNADGDGVGNGAHHHISIYDSKGRNVLVGQDGRAPLSEWGSWWLSGVFHSLAGLRLIAASSPVSDLRLKPGAWSGAYACWGIENREAALRLVLNGENTNVEVKFGDCSGNPYLVLTGALGCGQSGVLNRSPLPPPTDANILASGRQVEGLDMLPARLPEAIDAFRADETLLTAFDKRLVDAFLTSRQTEAAQMATRTARELVEIYRWVF